MMDYFGLEHDIAFVKGIIAAANTKITEIESTAKRIKSELNMIKPDTPEAPAWKPEDLIGKFVRTSKNVDGDTLIGILDGVDRLGNTVIYTVNKRRFLEVWPLTEAEALALVWRKPGSVVCPHCHKEAFYASSNYRGSSRVVCSECGEPWNYPITEKPKTRYDWGHKDIPIWANWMAKDEDGYPFAYASKPEIHSKTLWSNTSNLWQHIPKYCILDSSGDWRDSLERRPK